MTDRIAISSGNGITIHVNKWRIALDPRRPPSADVTFVSHAHIDHIHKSSNKSKILTSNETAFLAERRGFDLGQTCECFNSLQMIKSGHILGSQGLLIDDRIYYTGDFNTRPRAFLEGGRAVKCDILIMESTFGMGKYKFPPLAKILEQTNRLISDLFSKGIPVVLMGYPLGKAQILSDLFSAWDPVYLHSAILDLNQAHIDLGIELRTDLQSYDQALEKGLLGRGPWVLISPLKSGRSAFVRSLKNRYGAVTVAFSGWSMDPDYKYAMAVDHALPLSDHCDFDELVDFVRQCSPKKVYTSHGYAAEFAFQLRKLGFDAMPLLDIQKSIRDYVRSD